MEQDLDAPFGFPRPVSSMSALGQKQPSTQVCAVSALRQKRTLFDDHSRDQWGMHATPNHVCGDGLGQLRGL